MGLDQYLMTEDGRELYYWRKANEIHHYMVEVATNREQVENDNCTDFYIERSDIENLRGICWKLVTLGTHLMDVESWKDYTDVKEEFRETAQELLPTQGGFFFGSTEYDSRYVQNLFNTVCNLDKILSEHNDNRFIYYAWY